MKHLKFLSLALFFIVGTINLNAQNDDEATGMLGDNFSLEGALEVFKKSESLEEFEEMLNNEEKAINNLDLNDDGDIDYIRVEDNMDGDVHAIVLQALISEDESQDIAVIEIEKTGNESATLQIVGDEELYGDEYYVEPYEEEATSDGKGGPSADYVVTRIVINVWGWPSVRWVYRPNYVVYRSPWRWGVYPRIWRPWRPLTWNVYVGKRRPYRVGYHRVRTHRVVKAHRVYTPKRKSSTTVVRKSRTTTTVRKNKAGKTTVSRTKKTTAVKKNKNGKVTAKKSKKTTKVKKNKNGKVKAKKTTKTKKVKKRGG